MAHFNWFKNGFKRINGGTVKRLWGQVGIAALLAIVLIGIGAPSVSASHILTRGAAHRTTSAPAPTHTPTPQPTHVRPAPTPTSHSKASQSTSSGHSSIKANATAGSLLWSYKTGIILSSQIVDNGVLYASSWNYRVYALNAASGSVLWSFQTGQSVPTLPVLVNGTLYVGSDYLYALDASTGALRWRYEAHGNVEASPTVVNGVIYVGSQPIAGAYGTITALDAASGTPLWSYGLIYGGPDFPPIVVNGVVYISTVDDYDYAFDAASGALLWSYQNGSSQAPVVVGGVVYGSGGGSTYALNAVSGALLWSYPSGGGLGPVVVNGIVYASLGSGIDALDASTGSLLWSAATGWSSSPQTPLMVAGGIVYIGAQILTSTSCDGVVYAFIAVSGALLWSYQTGDDSCSAETSLIAVNGVIYFGSNDSYVYALDASTGALLWRYFTGDYFYSTESPSVANGMLYVDTSDSTPGGGYLDAFAASPPQQQPAQGPLTTERQGGNPSENLYCYQCAGDPIDTYSGAFSHTFADLSLPGRGIALDFSHTYNAGAAAVNGPLGYGWTDSYHWGLSSDGAGNITIAQENGSTVTFAPNGAGGYAPPSRVLATLVHNGDGSYTFLRAQTQDRYTFNSSGQLTAEANRNGYTTSLSYNGSGQLATVTDPAGRALTVSYDGSGRISSVADSASRSVSFTYDGNGNLQTATDVGGGVTTFTYDSNHLLLTMTDPRHGLTTNVYDGSGRVTSQQDPMGRITTFRYTAPDSNGDSSTTITDPNGNATVDQYYNGLLLSETRGYGTSQAATWSYTYDPVSLGLASTVDPNGNITSQTWDAQGNPLSTTDALGRTTSSTYDALNDLTSRTDALQVTTTYRYDTHGNLLSVSTPLVGTSQTQTTSYTYGDAAHPGDVTAMTDPDGAVWRYAYDAAGDRTRITDPLHDTTTATYDNLGMLTAQVSARGNVVGMAPAQFTTRYTYDAFGDVTQITDPLSGVTKKVYDADRNLVQETDADHNTTGYTYNADNELTQTTQADGTVEQDGYDGDGNQTSVLDGNHNTTAYTYDALNRLTSVTDPLNRTTTYGYDGVGNRTSVTDAAQQVTRYTYDTANQLTHATYSDGQTPSVTYAYDADGQRLSMQDGTGTTAYTYDSLQRLVSSTNGAGATVSYGYDLKDQLISLTYPGGQRVTRAYDRAGRLIAVTDWNGATSRFGYDADGDLTRATTANGVLTTLAYDANDHIGGITYVLAPTPIVDNPIAGRAPSSAAAQIATANSPLSVVYSRDGLGQVTSQRAQGLPPQSQLYHYTPLNQLSGANSGPYSYDGAGDLTQSGSATLSYDKANEVTGLTQPGQGAENFAYDARGNRISASGGGSPTVSYGYNQANRLVSYSASSQQVSVSATYAYDGDGLRASETVGGSTTHFTWQANGALPLLLQDGSTSYVYGPNDLPLEQVSASGATLSFAQDQLGSTLFLTDSHAALVATYAYDAYGAVTVHTGTATTALLYAGQYTDAESRLIYLRARFYDPATAQFLTRDPLALLTHAPYGYASDNPLNLIDISGLAVALACDTVSASFFYSVQIQVCAGQGPQESIFTETLSGGVQSTPGVGATTGLQVDPAANTAQDLQGSSAYVSGNAGVVNASTGFDTCSGEPTSYDIEVGAKTDPGIGGGTSQTWAQSGPPVPADFTIFPAPSSLFSLFPW